jgi:hypothetical protein
VNHVDENSAEIKARGPGNWFAVSRDLFEHPVVGTQVKPLNPGDPSRYPWPPMMAWLWLIAEAAWDERKHLIMGAEVRIKRGQVAHSYRYLAKRFNWTEKGTREWLARLKRFEMIEIVSSNSQLQSGAGKGAGKGAGQNIINVCNYESYQNARSANGASEGAGDGARGAQQGRSRGAKRNKGTREQGNNRNNSSSSNPIGLKEEEASKPLQLSSAVVDALKQLVGQTYADELVEKYLANPYSRRAKVIDKAFQGWLRKTYGIVISLAGGAMPTRADNLDLCPKDEHGRPITELPKVVTPNAARNWRALGSATRKFMNGGSH